VASILRAGGAGDTTTEPKKHDPGARVRPYKGTDI